MVTTTRECPLGKECKTIIDSENDLKCLWLIPLNSINAKGEPVEEERCVFIWLPILQIEMITTLKTLIEKEKINENN